jgi:signal transduction histidine kinase
MFRGDAGEVLRQASAVVGRPVTLWEVTGAYEAVPRATSDPAPGAHLPRFDLDATLRRWNIPVPVGSLWVAAPGAGTEAWVVAPVRSRPPAPPPGGRERRSKERLALELAGLALGLIDPSAPERGSAVQDASNPLNTARAGLQLSMESIGRWVDLAADRRLALLDDLGGVLDDIDRASEFLSAMRTRPGGTILRAERFDATRVVRSCITLERRLLRDRGIELDFATTLDATFLKGDPNALFDLLVNLVRGAAEATTQAPGPLRVQLRAKGRDLELVVHGFGAMSPATLERARSVAVGVFGGALRVDASPGAGSTSTVVLPIPPQRENR